MPLFGRRRRTSDPAAADPTAAPDPADGAAVDVDAAVEVDPAAGAAGLAGPEIAEVAGFAAAGSELAAPAPVAPEVAGPAAPEMAEPLDDPAAQIIGPVVGAKPTGPVPRDAADAGPHEQVLDLGAVRLPTENEVLENIEIQLQADPESGAVLALLLVDGPEKALEIRPFAAPRHESLWDEIRAEIAAEAATAGGLSQAADGRWGTELLVQVAVKLPDGQDAVQVTRFVGIDGPRWFVRGAFLGRAAIEPETAARLDAILAGLTVVRGDAAMAPRDPLPFVLPGQPVTDPVDPATGTSRPPLEPFERGPEITEIR